MSSDLRVEAELRLPAFTLRATFDVSPGLSVLFGPSGAGKSLTLQAIAGLTSLTSGSIVLGEQVLTDTARGIALPPRQRRVGYVPQQYALFPHLTVAENVAYALPKRRYLWDRAAQRRTAARVAELLALVRLPGFEARRPHQLSGGQAQRVALARALAAQPKALLLDEPLAALDAPTRAAVQDDLRAVVLESGVPAIVVTHDLAEARALGDRLVVLIDGAVVAAGPIAETLASPPTAEAALLLGWRNVLPIARISRTETRIELPGGQALRLPTEFSTRASSSRDDAQASAQHVDGTEGTERLALALHSDRMEIWRTDGNLPHAPTLERDTIDLSIPSTSGASPHVDARSWADDLLKGSLVAVADAGAHYVLRVALVSAHGGHESGAQIVVTCSPREWTALRATVGDHVIVHVPAAATRLVSAGTNVGKESSGEEGGDAGG
jgi:ABC-type sulfate/molybdate transport systems ATPase subunit